MRVVVGGGGREVSGGRYVGGGGDREGMNIRKNCVMA